MLALPIWADGGAARAAAGGPTAAPVMQQRQRDERAPGFRAPDVAIREQKQAKLDSTLALVSRAAGGRGDQNPLDVARSREVDVVHNALVRVVVESAGARQQAINAVRAAGGVVEAEYRDLVQALVAPQQLDALAADGGVAYVRQPARPFHDAVGGEGVGASGASGWHAEGFTGQNVKVGVIDAGFTGYQTRQAQGDLPNNLTLVDFCGGQTTPAGGEHGAAVAEIVYEMAPGIQLYLLCIGTEVQLGQAKDYAKANGISILVMSMSWFNTSRGDGTGSASSPNATVADARANGILWVNSAGNRAQQHYGAFFNDSDSNDAHNFNGTDEGNTIPLAAGQTTCIFLRWDAWPTTNQDFDLYLTVSQTGTIVASSVGDQTGTQPPTEGLCYTNSTGVSQNFAIFIDRFSATTNPYMDLFITPGPNLEYQVPTGSVTEPGTSPNVMTVAAICWQNDRREDYSSIGPTIDGRIKPDIAGQTAVSSGSFGPWSSCPGGSNGQGGFNGTSAATPHVGGAAALVKGANPSFTPAQLQSFLEGRATELGPAGKDNLFGSGKLQLGAAPLLPVACSPRPAVTIQTTVSGGRQSVHVTVTGANNRLLSISFGAPGRPPVNALLDLPDGSIGVTGTPIWTAGPGVTQTTFYVRRQAAGPVTVPFVVADRCGAWTTFVGGGASATGF
ncbi:MAG: S8 family serine peptidase [Chloroflexi bacterium]|nr:S8 family serine peptidase [Chloroflexota bacterium]